MDDDDEEEEGEEEEEEEDEGDEEEDDGDEEGGDDPEAKIKAVKADIALIHDVFSYIDKTTRRITTQMASTNKIKELEEKLNNNNNNNTNYPVHHDDDMSLHWSQYEDMDESQRAELLERAIMVLGNDQSEILQPQPPRANNNIRKGDYRKK